MKGAGQGEEENPTLQIAWGRVNQLTLSTGGYPHGS